MAERDKSYFSAFEAARDFAAFVDDLHQRRVSEKQPDADPETLARLTRLLEEAASFIEFLSNRIAKTTEGQAWPPESNGGPRTWSGLRGKGFLETLRMIVARAISHPEQLAEQYSIFAKEVLAAISSPQRLDEKEVDRRFRDDLWRSNAFFRGLVQIYFSWTKSMRGWLEEQQFDGSDRQRAQFVFDQLIAAFSPSNLPINPAALRRADQTRGESAVRGLRQWIEDALTNRGMPRQIEPNAYELGKDLAITPGSVVFRNEVLELIQYQPTTDKVFRRPIVYIPPQINKYYAFDLRPANSIIRYLVENRIQTFTISWRNPTRENRHWNLDTYIASLIQALEAVRTITRSRTVNLTSACAGTYTAVALMGWMAATKNRWVHSHSLLVTSLVSCQESLGEIFATRETFEIAREFSEQNGVMEGSDLAKIFHWLRPNDLVWNYWVNNYLMGRKPPALDVLFWDNDSTRLPATLHSDFLELYGEQVFERPNRFRVLGVPFNLKKIKVDSYILGGKDDYLMPWKGVYQTMKLLPGNHVFVLSTSGHVQSVLRPPGLGRIEYFTNEEQHAAPEDWLRTATRREGSWWLHWMSWLSRRSGELKVAPRKVGDATFSPLKSAPGMYVRE